MRIDALAWMSETNTEDVVTHISYSNHKSDCSWFCTGKQSLTRLATFAASRLHHALKCIVCASHREIADNFRERCNLRLATSCLRLPFPVDMEMTSSEKTWRCPRHGAGRRSSLRFLWVFIALQALYTATIKQPMSFLFTDVPGLWLWPTMAVASLDEFFVDTNLRLML